MGLVNIERGLFLVLLLSTWIFTASLYFSFLTQHHELSEELSSLSHSLQIQLEVSISHSHKIISSLQSKIEELEQKIQILMEAYASSSAPSLSSAQSTPYLASPTLSKDPILSVLNPETDRFQLLSSLVKNKNANQEAEFIAKLPPVFLTTMTDPPIILLTPDPKQDLGLSSVLSNNHIWEPEVTSLFQWLGEECSSDRLIVDVGANVGYYSLYSAALGCSVLAIEPQPELCDLIVRSKKKNVFSGDIEVMKAFISDYPNTNSIYRHKTNWGGAGRLTGIDDNYVFIDNLESESLDNLLLHKPKNKKTSKDNLGGGGGGGGEKKEYWKSIYVMKIDVEGHCSEVFRTAKKLIGSSFVENFIVEFTPVFWVLELSKQWFDDFKKYGYEVIEIPPLFETKSKLDDKTVASIKPLTIQSFHNLFQTLTDSCSNSGKCTTWLWIRLIS